MARYNAKKAEKHWQAEWEARALFVTPAHSEKPKCYVLEMFPYPSGRIHMGHARNYTMGDVLARFRRMQGYSVLHPMGWDAFGLPAENHAIRTGIHPAKTTQVAIETFRRQIKSIGLSYDWTREIATSDPAYYKWTQWIFLRMFERGLAYKSNIPINWCPKDRTGLAN